MEKEILEGNKLIAEFLKLETCTDKECSGNLCYFYEPLSRYLKVSDMDFHENWKSLMPVVERIEKECKALVNINSVSCEIKTIPFHIEIIDDNVTKNHSKYSIYRESNSKIESTWLCVVDFIHFYNTQNKQ